MGFLSRDKKKSSPQRRSVPGHDDLVMVPDDEIAPVINGLTEIVSQGMADFPFRNETLQLLRVGLPYLAQREFSDEAWLAGQTAARLGYLSRSAEFTKCQAAREADLDLLETLSERIQTAETHGGSVPTRCGSERPVGQPEALAKDEQRERRSRLLLDEGSGLARLASNSVR